MNSLEILFNLLIHPHYALRRQGKSLGLSIAVVVLAIWSLTVGSYLVNGVSINAGVFSFSLIASIITTLLLIFIGASLWHFISESFRGEGKVNELFLCMCLSFLPFVFFTPIALMIKFLEGSVVCWLLFRTVIFAWVITLQIFSIKMVYELNGPLAILTYFIPFMAVFVILFFVFMLLVLLFVFMSSQAFAPLLNL
jgi:hypothetical protein